MNARCLRPRHRLVLLSATALLASCIVDVRQGPPFDEAIPDANVLVTTTDAPAVRAKLATVQLPATRAHDDRLLAHSVPTSSSFVTMTDGDLHVYGERGAGEFAPVIDQLLTEGIDPRGRRRPPPARRADRREPERRDDAPVGRSIPRARRRRLATRARRHPRRHAGFARVDNGGEGALAVMRARWVELSEADREQLLTAFPLYSNREHATRLPRQ